MAAAAFWTHDALPYLLDYTQDTYSRFWSDRIPLLVHIAGGTIAMFAGPLQLWTGLRGLVPRLLGTPSRPHATPAVVLWCSFR